MTAIQEQMTGNFCWGCGADNHAGLRLLSYLQDDGTTIATWTPAPEHADGPRHVLTGAIMVALQDCDDAATAIAELSGCQDWESGSDPDIWCATSSMYVDYLRPATLG